MLFVVLDLVIIFQVLEAVHIAMSKPVLCVQKSYVLSLHLVNTLVV